MRETEYPAVMIKIVNTFITHPTMLAILENLQENQFSIAAIYAGVMEVQTGSGYILQGVSIIEFMK